MSGEVVTCSDKLLRLLVVVAFVFGLRSVADVAKTDRGWAGCHIGVQTHTLFLSLSFLFIFRFSLVLDL